MAAVEAAAQVREAQEVLAVLLQPLRPYRDVRIVDGLLLGAGTRLLARTSSFPLEGLDQVRAEAVTEP